MQFSAAIKSSRGALLKLVTAKENGMDCWFYVQLDKKLAPIFENEIKSSNIESLKKYGEIIYSGWGKEPPESIKKKIEEQF